MDALSPAERATPLPLNLAPAPRPVARVGDTYFFGAQSLRQVTAVSSGSVTWTTTDGQRLRTGPPGSVRRTTGTVAATRALPERQAGPNRRMPWTRLTATKK